MCSSSDCPLASCRPMLCAVDAGTSDGSLTAASGTKWTPSPNSARVEAEFGDGVHFVPLAAVRDPSLVPASTAQSIGLQDARGQSLLEHITSYLADRKVLLILDNFEHVLPAGEFVAE